MENVAAISGWFWIKQGFSLFRRQPAEMAILFVLYFILNVIISGIIPLVGLALRFILLPAFSMAFMLACADIEQGRRVYPKVLFAGFRIPAFKALMMLGIAYLLIAVLALAAVNLIDDGILWQALNNNSQAGGPKTTEDMNLVLPMFFWSVIYFSASLPLWYATPLIAWQKMPVGKAIFFSCFSVIRAIKALMVYIFAWMAIGMLLLLFLSILLGALVDDVQTEAFVLMPFFVLLAAVVQCSVYPSYTQIFGAPELPAL